MLRKMTALTIAGCALALATSGAAETNPAEEVEAVTSMLPPNARPGECYARLFVPPEYKNVSKTVVKREAGIKIETTPAEYEWIEEEVLVKEAFEKLEVIPAEFKWVEEEVLVKPAGEKLVAVEAEYETVEERVLVRDGYTTWKKGRGPIEKIDHGTGEIMCLVNVPPEYKTMTKRVLVRPAGVDKIEVPAEHATVKKEVLVKAAETRKIEVPAEYKTVKTMKLVQPAQEIRTEIPAEVETVAENVKVKDGRMEWRPILCETNTSPDVVRKLQSALMNAGFNPGAIDGSLGGRTFTAVQAYQQANGLPSGQLTLETLNSLGVLTN